MFVVPGAVRDDGVVHVGARVKHSQRIKNLLIIKRGREGERGREGKGKGRGGVEGHTFSCISFRYSLPEAFSRTELRMV